MAVGKAAYEGYCQSSNNKSLVSGDTLPTWENLPTDIQTAWVAAALAGVSKAHDLDAGAGTVSTLAEP